MTATAADGLPIMVDTTVVVVGAYPAGVHGLDLHRLMFAELTVVGTRIYLRSDIEAAIDLVTAGRLDVRPVVSRIAPLHEAAAAVDELRRGEGMKVLIEPAAGRAGGA